MTEPAAPTDPARFAPHAVRELGGMFDDVSGRYDLLNRIMSLGQDRAWRAAMWRAVPERAHVVLDLCTGSGVSLTGLRRPGRLVLGADASLRMLELAADHHGRAGWAPRLVCADGFHLPLPDGSLDAVTIAFGIRNLRPLDDALAELARVLRPDGTLVVLEAAAPAPGPFAPFHGFYVRRVIPLAGRLSADPSAYAYLSRSIFDFGDGPEFERAVAAAGFEVVASRRFMLGATRLWVAQRSPGTGKKVAAPDGRGMQNARPGGQDGVKVPSPADLRSGEWRVWTGVQAALALAITVALAFGLVQLVKSGADLPLAAWQRSLAWFLVVGGLVVFAVRSLLLLRRFLEPPPRP
jgi:demethylmenaquinone methyltransferase/2-methoxy-6-polyprenyl-1,4-benzoquinol methylase